MLRDLIPFCITLFALQILALLPAPPLSPSLPHTPPLSHSLVFFLCHTFPLFLLLLYIFFIVSTTILPSSYTSSLYSFHPYIHIIYIPLPLTLVFFLATHQTPSSTLWHSLLFTLQVCLFLPLLCFPCLILPILHLHIQHTAASQYMHASHPLFLTRLPPAPTPPPPLYPCSLVPLTLPSWQFHFCVCGLWSPLPMGLFFYSIEIESDRRKERQTVGR